MRKGGLAYQDRQNYRDVGKEGIKAHCRHRLCARVQQRELSLY